MTDEELRNLLDTIGIPVAYRAFSESQKMPYICFLETGNNNFAADGIVYFGTRTVHIELYTRFKDWELEKKVESVLSQMYWDKSQEYIESEKCYQTVYEIEV